MREKIEQLLEEIQANTLAGMKVEHCTDASVHHSRGLDDAYYWMKRKLNIILEEDELSQNETSPPSDQSVEQFFSNRSIHQKLDSVEKKIDMLMVRSARSLS